MGLVWSSIGLLAQNSRSYDYDAVLNENRLTKLETQIQEITSQLKAIQDGQDSTQQVEYLGLLILSGLAGEAGVRLYKKKADSE
jgi:hypothetical protein